MTRPFLIVTLAACAGGWSIAPAGEPHPDVDSTRFYRTYFKDSAPDHTGSVTFGGQREPVT